MDSPSTCEGILTYLKQIFLHQGDAPLLFTSFYFWGFFALVMGVYALIHKRFVLRSFFPVCGQSFLLLENQWLLFPYPDLFHSFRLRDRIADPQVQSQGHSIVFTGHQYHRESGYALLF